MKYSIDEVLQYIKEEDVKFIRLAFCDVFGRQKNISIMPGELERAFNQGIAFDASAIAGFRDESFSDLFLIPDADTLSFLPWRPEHGKVVRMFTTINNPDGSVFCGDTRSLLKKAVDDAEKAGYSFNFGTEQEFYLFNLDENGNPTNIPYDNAGYMDIAPADKGENIRREICLTLEQMGIFPESSHHEQGPGQNEIDFRYSDPLTTADNSLTFRTVVRTVAGRNGIHVDFSPKPLENEAGNGCHINISIKPDVGSVNLCYMIAGVLDKIDEMTAVLNPTEASYNRFGHNKAPSYISWSAENRSQLVRIPAAVGEYRRAELRSPDPTVNPYLAFTLLIYAGLYGIEKKLDLPEAANINLFRVNEDITSKYKHLPTSLEAAQKIMKNSDFVKSCLPKQIFDIYCGG
ncbi:MAG: glutamine synthetase family protein [Clostridia bacterium]|nr:glutamine synthetase family protein [Clostridia bacterium]